MISHHLGFGGLKLRKRQSPEKRPPERPPPSCYYSSYIRATATLRNCEFLSTRTFAPGQTNVTGHINWNVIISQHVGFGVLAALGGEASK